MREVQLQVQVVERLLHDGEDLLMKVVGDRKANDQRGYGVDKPGAELGEVLHKRHAGKFGTVGDGGFYIVDDVGHG